MTPELSQLPTILADLPTGQLFVLTDSHTMVHCLPILADSIGQIPYHLFTIEAGEQSKNLASVQLVWDFLLKHHATREALLINLGGGMITDLGGFAAATYMRGIRFVNIPTTLLAMVDASSGGKTGFDYQGIKNVIGTFTPPLTTLIHPQFLRTLPATELLSGFAEMLKHGLVANATHWQELLRWNIHEQDIATLAPLIADSIAIKQQIVSDDPYEKNIRRTLNFGHTIGHAIEAAYLQQGLQSYHGHCVLWGMVAEVYLSVVHAGCPRDVLTMLTHLMVEHYGRPQCNCQQQGLLLEWMRHDKKNHDANHLNFTLLRCIGTPIIDQALTDKDVNEALEYLFSL
jgi:3-dehydroquinate synthase